MAIISTTETPLDLGSTMENLIHDYGYDLVLDSIADLIEDAMHSPDARIISKRSGKQAIIKLTEARHWIGEG